ncbi:MAG: GNAT family N-acetyltransferase [Lactobacillales bacterium]|jgi:ribosomal protein S18 acetylase RimI-like enzyme|nr:GNAT family N-acetyltransferase [Lactobacillales bacterium]
MTRVEYDPEKLMLVDYRLIDKQQFEFFDTGNLIVTESFHVDLAKEISEDSGYKAFCMIPNAGSVILGFFSLSKSAEFELEEGYTFVRNYNYIKIDWFGISKEYHHSGKLQGYGKHLIYHAYKIIIDLHPEVEIICLEAKVDAIIAYEHYGFEVINNAVVSGGADMFVPVSVAQEYIKVYEQNELK